MFCNKPFVLTSCNYPVTWNVYNFNLTERLKEIRQFKSYFCSCFCPAAYVSSTHVTIFQHVENQQYDITGYKTRPEQIEYVGGDSEVWNQAGKYKYKATVIVFPLFIWREDDFEFPGMFCALASSFLANTLQCREIISSYSRKSAVYTFIDPSSWLTQVRRRL